jgi:uncharacterized protein (TIGR02145 family)
MQFLAEIYPSNVTNKNIVWSVVQGSGPGAVTGTIHPNTGLFTAGSAGNVSIRASTVDNSGVYGEKQITVSPIGVPVSNIVVSSANSSTTINAPGTLQLTATVSPSNATNDRLMWNIVSGNGATVNSNGLVTGISSGNTTVRATSISNPAMFGEIVLSITSSTHPGLNTVAGSSGATYYVYCYPNGIGCWMIDNSKEPGWSADTYQNQSAGARGYYYSWNAAFNACPQGYSLPTQNQWSLLKSYINGYTSTVNEKRHWTGDEAFAGYYQLTGSLWFDWDASGVWWSRTNTDQAFHAVANALSGPETHTSRFVSVRCVKPN